MRFLAEEKEAQSNIFNILDDKKRELIARGEDVINLSVGTPDFQPDRHVMEAVQTAAQDPQNFKYSLGDLPELTEAVLHWYDRRYGVSLERNEVTSVNGSQEGIAHIAFPVCQKGDIVLCPDPGYPIFSFGPQIAGAHIGLLPLTEENHYLIDFEKIPSSIAHRTKAMVVSYPSNPLTAMADEAFYERLVYFAKQYDILVIHDNAYSELVFDGKKGGSFLEIPGAKEIGVEFNSLSKSYNYTGARASFALGRQDVIAKFKAFRSQIDYGMFLPVQYGAIAALTGPQDIVVRNREGYENRRNVLCGGFRKIGWNVPNSQATMFVWAKVPEKFADAPTFVLELMEKTGVICVPGDSFGELGKGYVRFALVEPEVRLLEAVNRIEQSGILK